MFDKKYKIPQEILKSNPRVFKYKIDDENVYEIPYLDFQSISMVIDKNYI